MQGMAVINKSLVCSSSHSNQDTYFFERLILSYLTFWLSLLVILPLLDMLESLLTNHYRTKVNIIICLSLSLITAYMLFKHLHEGDIVHI